MAERGKRITEAKKLVDKENLFDLKEAVELLQKASTAKFDETVEVAVKLGVNPKHADQQIRGTVVLPNGTGKEQKVLVFAKGEKIKEAEESGADYVGGEELAEKIQGGWLDFDVTIATPDMMNVVGKLGKVLGPRGLMPNPKTGTVTFDIAKAVEESKAGKIEYRVDKAGIVHAPLGKVSFDDDAIVENFSALLDALVKARPASAKGQYLRGIAISTTMGPGVKVNHHKVAKQT